MRHSILIGLAMFCLGMLLLAGCGISNLSVTSTPNGNLPDLVIEGRRIELETESACLHGMEELQKMGLAVTIQNVGKADASTFVVQVGKELRTVKGLKTGASLRLFLPLDYSNTTVIVDVDNQIQESNKANNMLSNQPLPVPTPPLLCTPIGEATHPTPTP